MTIIKQAYTAESIISGIPYCINSVAYTSQSHYFIDADGIEKNCQWISVTNTGLTGTLCVAFEPTGFDTNKCFTLRGGETFHEALMISKVYVSGAAAQPYNITVGLTAINQVTQTTTEPDDVSGLHAWWRASDNVVTSGTVTTWTDKTSNGWKLESPTAAVTPGISASNPYFQGQQTLNFDGVNDYMSCSNQISSSFDLLYNGSGMTIFTCFMSRKNDTNSKAVWANCSYVGPVAEGAWLNNYTDSLRYSTYISGSTIVNSLGTSTVVKTFVPIISCHTFGTASSPKAVYNLYNSLGATANPGAFSTISNAASVFTVGALSFPGLLGWAHMDLAEIVIYNRVLTSAEKSTVTNYLNRRYGTAY